MEDDGVEHFRSSKLDGNWTMVAGIRRTSLIRNGENHGTFPMDRKSRFERKTERDGAKEELTQGNILGTTDGIHSGSCGLQTITELII